MLIMHDKLNTLPSSYREKKRYVTFKIISESEIGTNDLVKALWKNLINDMGVIDVAKTNFHFFTELYEQADKKFVIRCLPGDVEKIRLSFALITEIEGKPVCLASIGISGTMRASKKKHLKKLTIGAYKMGSISPGPTLNGD
jgi:ribonuclease P/MRP protein subunit POP5